MDFPAPVSYRGRPRRFGAERQSSYELGFPTAWMIENHHFLIGKPSIFMGHLCHSKLLVYNDSCFSLIFCVRFHLKEKLSL